MFFNYNPDLLSKNCGRPQRALQDIFRTHRQHIFKAKMASRIHRRHGRILELKGPLTAHPSSHLERSREDRDLPHAHSKDTAAAGETPLSELPPGAFGLARPLLLLLRTHRSLESGSLRAQRMDVTGGSGKANEPEFQVSGGRECWEASHHLTAPLGDGVAASQDEMPICLSLPVVHA